MLHLEKYLITGFPDSLQILIQLYQGNLLGNNVLVNYCKELLRHFLLIFLYSYPIFLYTLIQHLFHYCNYNFSFRNTNLRKKCFIVKIQR